MDSIKLNLKGRYSGHAVVVTLLLCSVFFSAAADQTYAVNKRANALYRKGQYKEALDLYEEALLEAPDEPRLRINKGSALYKLGDYEQAEDMYKEAAGVEDKEAKADLFYNAGNAMFMQAMARAKKGDQQALDKFKAARDSYITALEIRHNDRAAKWNLEVTNGIVDVLEKMQEQQKEQNKNDQDKEPPEPSEYAKKIKAQADKLVSERKYGEALQLMQGLLEKDPTAYAFMDYVKRLNDVVEVSSS